MKSRFFNKKSSSNSKNEFIPQSSSYDSQLCEQLQKTTFFNAKQRKNAFAVTNFRNTSINTNTPLETTQRNSSSFCKKLCNSNNASSSSSTQGIIGCSNGLFECYNNVSTNLFPTEMQLIAEGKRAYFGRIKKQIEPSESLINYSPSHRQQLIDQKLIQQYGGILINEEEENNNNNNNQIAQLVFTLAKQLNLKDLEINKIKNKLKKRENRDEKIFEKLNEELKENKEEIKRLKRKLKSVDFELIKELNNKKINNIEELKESEREKLMSKISELQNKLKFEQNCHQNRQAEWEGERLELIKKNKELNCLIEKMSKEHEYTEENCKQLEIQLELSKIDLTPNFMGKDREEQVVFPFLDFPSPKIYSTSTDSSSGISSSLKGINHDKNLNNKLIKAKENLTECREKINQLIKTTEKLEKGDKLKGEDLFGLPFVKENNIKNLDSYLEEQIEALQKELEILHDKLTILYAKGAI